VRLRPRHKWDHAVGIDFDLGAQATRFEVEATLGGRALAPQQLLLGADHTPATTQPASFAPGDERLGVSGAGNVPVEAESTRARVYLWEARLPRGAELRMSERELEALRALGYVH
jgi:hypothetical protein